MTQTYTKKVDVRDIVGCCAFDRGVRDFISHQTPPELIDQVEPFAACSGTALSYERGRLFAAYCVGQGLSIPDDLDGRMDIWNQISNRLIP